MSLSKKSSDYPNLLKKSLTGMFLSLIKIKKVFPSIVKIKTEFESVDIKETARIIISEMQGEEEELFNNEISPGSKLFTLILFRGNLNLGDIPVANRPSVVKQLKIIYINAQGALNISKKKLELETIQTPAIAIESLPPNLKEIFDDVFNGIDINNLNTGNPMMLMAIIPTLMDKVSVIPERLKTCDADKVGEEIAFLLKKFQASF